jgi:hypothetical protein
VRPRSSSKPSSATNRRGRRASFEGRARCPHRAESVYEQFALVRWRME